MMNGYGDSMHDNSIEKSDFGRNGCPFVPPLDAITGESFMPADSVLVPLIPPSGPVPQNSGSGFQTAVFLSRHIGRMVRIQYAFGARGGMGEKTGVLTEVNADYLVIKQPLTNDLIMCDTASVRCAAVLNVSDEAGNK